MPASKASAIQPGLQFVEPVPASFDELPGDLRPAQPAAVALDQLAHTLLVTLHRRNLLRVGPPKDRLQFAEARETKVLRKAHHRRRMNIARLGDVTDPVHHHTGAMLLDVRGDALQLPWQRVVSCGNPLNKFVNARRGVISPQTYNAPRRTPEK